MPLNESDPALIRDVIQQQLQAFQQGDGEAAYALASPGIQDLFPSVTLFMAMVANSYDPVYRPRSVVFEDAVIAQGIPVQPVLYMAQNGSLYRAFYVMGRYEGSWRIEGCQLNPLQE